MTATPEDPIVTITDIRKAGHCPSGARDWFKAHDLDFRAFLAHGLPASTLLATGDAYAEQVVSRKRERERG